MTIGPEQRNADFNSQQAAYQKNAAMRGEHAPDFEAHHRRLNAENIDLRAQLDMSRKATSAAQELLEAERQKCAKIEADGAQQAFSMGEAMGAVIREKAAIQEKIGVLEKEREFLLTDNRESKSAKYRLMSALDTEKLLRANDAATIADLERRLKEAEAQLKAQRRTAPLIVNGVKVPRDERGRVLLTDWERAVTARNDPLAWYREQRTRLAAQNAKLVRTIESQEVTIRQLKAQIEVMPVTVRGEPTVARKVLEAELEEMRRTFRLIAGTTKEYFDLITELASDPADEKRKEPRNYVEFPNYAIGNLTEIKEPKE